MKEIVLDTLLDTIKLIPFLFIAFLIIELIEHKLNDKSKKAIISSGKFGPVLGSILGVIPQCGFSVMTTNLYLTRIISLGTLISIYLSTSDEMLPIMLSQNVPFNQIFSIIVIKVVVGMIVGIIIDLVYRNTKKVNYDMCNKEHCDCNHGIVKSTIHHTVNIIIFIFISNFILNIVFEYFGNDILSKILLKDNVLGSFITSLIGLIPNCGSSVIITELYLNKAISYGALISGLLTNSGVAILLLFKLNKNTKENLSILSIIYFVGVIIGIFIELV